MPKIVVTGSEGQLGNSLKREFALFPKAAVEYIDKQDLDLTDADAVEEFFSGRDIDYVVNCAAYTAVDRAEEEREKAFDINTKAVGNLARQAANKGFKIIHISTDYVFSGEKESPYKEEDIYSEEEKAAAGPKTRYGQTKLAGEKELFYQAPDSMVIRTSWLYSEFGKNFVKTMLSRAIDKSPVKVVEDQTGCPTYAGDLAKAIVDILRGGKWTSGVYHYCNSGITNWFDFAREVYLNGGADSQLVTPIKTEQYPTAAQRPKNSALDTTKIQETYNLSIEDWRISLKIAFPSILTETKNSIR